MNKMLSVASGFQYSVNIGFDLNDNSKLKNFIPTQAAIELLEEILVSTKENSNNRARVIIGAYGKGKSHIVLVALALLLQKDINLFEHLIPKIRLNSKLNTILEDYYSKNGKILPVVINGSSNNLSQSFIMALRRTLSENNLLDIMPETNFNAACNIITKWKVEFPDTYNKLEEKLGYSAEKLVNALEDYDGLAYRKFESIFPSITSGNVFNPFLNYDVVELYEAAAKGLKAKGYSGLYVVYDEFSKFLESGITTASVNDIKMLQDFAEKCNRSGKNQMHLMLISHKEISNYIDKLPKQKVDGWRGVSERFTHVHLNSNFEQTYEVIETVIEKDNDSWPEFCKKKETSFSAILDFYKGNNIYSDVRDEVVTDVVYGCYPLHPVSLFILPRLSEKIAQNERTLFTFLSAQGPNTLNNYLSEADEDKFSLITPDYIYDYFEPLLKKEVYTQDLYEKYSLTSAILSNLQEQSLESKIVKTISLIYILGQFEKLQPTKTTIFNVFKFNYSQEEINSALESLINDKYLIFMKQSNGYLRLKRSTGVNVFEKINDFVEKNVSSIETKEILNAVNLDRYIYPYRYNDEKEMTRYFAFEFIDSSEVRRDVKWDIKSESIQADGVIYGIICDEHSDINEVYKAVLESSRGSKRCLFVALDEPYDIKATAQKFYAVSQLKDASVDNELLHDEYQVIYDDLYEVVNTFIAKYTHPENLMSICIYDGERKNSIIRRAALTALLSDICSDLFNNTPVIVNEALNKNEISSLANNSRIKVINGLLKNVVEKNLGLHGTGQEVSIMRSTLIKTGILENADTDNVVINLRPSNRLVNRMLAVIEGFIADVKKNKKMSFDELYRRLIVSENGIGLRKGLIPIYVAVVLHEYRKNIIIKSKFGQIPLNVDAIQQINSAPQNYYVEYLNWDEEKEEFVGKLAALFDKFVVEEERSVNDYEYVVSAMKKWYLSLPKYTKESNLDVTEYASLLKLFKKNISAQDLLFVELSRVFGFKEFDSQCYEKIVEAKRFIDEYLNHLENTLIALMKEKFILLSNKQYVEEASLTSIIIDWNNSINEKAFEQLFGNGTEKCLALFKDISNDENSFIKDIAKLASGLRVEDWNDNTIKRFENNVDIYKQTAEAFVIDRVESDLTENVDTCLDGYQITFNDNGRRITKRFDKIEYSKRAKLLLNEVQSSMEDMGTSITEQEKRQVLMDILKGLC